MKVHRSRLLAALVAAPLVLTGCSAGSLGSSSGDGEGGSTAITFLVDNGAGTADVAQALVDAFEADHPDISISVETRPGGGDGDNLIKTRLSTGTMADVFLYNSGSLFQQIDPTKNLTPLTDEDFASRIDEAWKPNVSAGGDLYGVPFGTSFGGGVLYNIPVYQELGLQVPTTWQQFIDNSQKIKDSGKDVAPIIQTYGDTWTSQLFVLGDFHNVAAAEPTWADDFTANRVKFATDPVAIKGFEHQQQVHDLGLMNEDFASATNADGLRMVAEGTGAQYPMLSAVVAGLQTAAPDNIDDVGFFALPGDDAATNGLTSWAANGLYVPSSTTGAKLDAVKEFLDFMTTPQACDVQSEANTPTGPYPITECTLPTDVPQLTKDVSAYFDGDKQSPALEFLSPVKGPALEQITVQVGSGISTAAEGAALYDQDVEKQAQQLGLPGW
ncbi:ABC transporter substrate-binding protein [Quadrisphaera sp. KR29]|uniref:ABC transporter substrate-binding protein n=1 Tax=Quadrisphaera sp. KR29 TaxID=3461391 RepID=UPI004045095E